MRLIFATSVLLLLAEFNFAQIVTVRAYPMEEKSLLWKIEGNDLKKPSYLFGTIHLIDSAKFYFPDLGEKLVRKSELVVTEIDESISDPMTSMNLLMLPSGTIFDFLSDEQGDSLIQWFDEKMGINESTFNLTMSKMKPFMIYTMMTFYSEDQPMQLGSLKNGTMSYDLYIQNLAEKHDKNIEGLETMEEQIGFFDEMDTLTQAEMIMTGVRQKTQEDGQSLSELEDIYLTQDLDSLYALTTGNMGALDNFESLLLDDRNIKWIPKLKEMMKENPCFIAVGAAHLGGPNGLIRLLEKEGYTLTPVKL